MKILTTEQRTPAWTQARVGMFSASQAGDMLAKIKSGEAAARRDLKLRIVCERLTGQSQEDVYVNAAMQRGIDCEAQARAAFESLTGYLVQEVGYLAHDSLKAGCSPDGLIDGGVRLVEIKAPKSSTMLAYLRAGVVPATYLPQLRHQAWITGASVIDFFAWDDRLPVGLQTFHATITREALDIPAYELEARAFLREIETELEAVRTLAHLAGQLEASVA